MKHLRKYILNWFIRLCMLYNLFNKHNIAILYYMCSDRTIGIIYYTSDIVIGTGIVYCIVHEAGRRRWFGVA